MDTALEKAIGGIRAAREAIWLEEPADLARLRTKKGAWDQTSSARLYAAMKLGQLVVFLNHLREVARHEHVDLETMKAVTDPLLPFYANQYGGFYGLTDTAEVVRQAREALASVRSLEDYVALVSELSLFIGHMDYWVDVLIPWSRFP